MDGGGRAVLSVEDALWAAHTQGGPPRREATTVQRALGGLERHGHAHEAAWPYGSPPFPAPRPPRVRSTEQHCPLGNWRSLKNARFESVAPELESKRSVVLTVRLVPTAWRRDDGWIDAGAGDIEQGGHAILAVGAESQTSSVPNHVIVKNSWGPNWGARGYGFISDRYLRHYGVVAHVLEGCP
jgi:C1A family cysteine protease